MPNGDIIFGNAKENIVVIVVGKHIYIPNIDPRMGKNPMIWQRLNICIQEAIPGD
jgi:hypothetical protein